MLPNERKLLEEFKNSREANAVAMATKIALSIPHTQYLCSRLYEDGKLEMISDESYPIYRIVEKENFFQNSNSSVSSKNIREAS